MAVNVFQGIQISHGHKLVDFVDGGIGWAEFNDLWANLRNEAPVTGAAGGGQFGVNAGFVMDGGLHSAYQVTRCGEEGQAADGPLEVEI